jgi:phosphate transport system substrate-binding protein
MLWTVGCGQPQLETPQATALVRIAGSTSMEPLLRELTRAYTQQHSHVQFDISSVGSSAGLELLRRGAIDMASVSRGLDRGERVDSRTGQPVLTFWTIAQDAIAVVVHPDSPLEKASLYVIQQVFSGRIWNCDELGGSPGDVTVVSREDGSATRDVFEELVMRSHSVTQAAIVMPSSSAVRDYVARHEGSIGYVSSAFVDASIKALTVDGTPPDPALLKNGQYSLTRPFLLVVLPNSGRAAKEFADWVVSSAGQAVVDKGNGVARVGQR